MKFATILREAGFSCERFKKCANIPIVLYDGKDRINSDEDIRFVERLFAHNSNSFLDFFEFLKVLEEKPCNSINVKIDENVVVLFYKTSKPKVFSRNESLNPMDYMD